MTKATITNGLTLDLGAFINDPESNFSITEHGFDIRAIDGKSINQGRMFGIRDTNDQTIGGFTAKLQPDPQIIVDATGDPGTNSPNAQFLARSTGQAEIESSDGPVILSANPNGGKIVLDGDRVIAKNVQKASSESGLSSPVDGEVWMDTDNKTLKMYEAGTLPTPVATPDFALTEIGDKKVRFISTTRVTTGRITGFDWSFDDGATDSGSPVVAHTYGSTGSYDATLTVTFDEGSTMSTTQTVSVDGDGFSLPILKDIRTDMDVR